MVHFHPIRTMWCLLLIAAGASIAWSDEVEDQYRVAAGHYSQQRWQAAVTEFDALLAAHPQHPLCESVRFFQGEALHQLRRYQAAHQHYTQYLTDHAHGKYRNHAFFRLGECSTLDGAHEQARAELERFLVDFPTDGHRGHAQLYLGQNLLALEKAKAATDAYLRSLELLLADKSPASLLNKCRFGLAKSLEATGERAQANRFYQFIASGDGEMADDALAQMIRNAFELTDHSGAETHIEQLRLRFPNSIHRPHVELLAGRIHLSRGEPLLAGELLLDQVDEATSADPGAEMLFEAGRSLHAARDKRADRCFQQIVARWPDSSLADDALYARILLAADGDVVQRCRAFVDAYPDSEFLQTVNEILSETLIRTARFTEAAETLESVHRKHGGARIAYLLMLSYLGAEQYDQAVSVARDISLEELDPEFRTGMLLGYASALMKSESFDEAANVLQSCLRLFAKATPAAAASEVSKCAAQRAVALAHLNQIEEAMEMLEYLPVNSPMRTSTTRFVAARARQIGAAPEAAILLEKLSNSDGASVSDLSALASALWETGDVSGAAARVSELQQQFPTESETHRQTLRHGQSLERLGKVDAAHQCYLWLAENGTGNARRAGAFLAARIYEQSGRDLQAVRLLQPLEAQSPNTKTDVPRDAVLYHLGWALLDLDRDEEAWSAFNQLAQSNKDSSLRTDAVFRVAKIEASRGDFDEAAARLEVALSHESELQQHMRMLRSQIAAAQGQWDVAQTHLTAMSQSSELTPKLRRDAWFYLGEAHYRQRHLRLAHEAFRMSQLALEAVTGPEAEPTWLPLLRLREAQILAHQKQWRAAGEAAQAVLQNYPQFAHGHEAAYLLGRAFAARARFSEARAAYLKVLEMPMARGTVTAAKAQWMIGETYFHQRNYEQAIRAYHRVELLHSHPSWQALALLQAAKCNARLGLADESTKMLNDVVRRFPETRAAKEAVAEQQRLGAAPTKAALHSPRSTPQSPNPPLPRR